MIETLFMKQLFKLNIIESDSIRARFCQVIVEARRKKIGEIDYNVPALRIKNFVSEIRWSMSITCLNLDFNLLWMKLISLCNCLLDVFLDKFCKQT